MKSIQIYGSYCIFIFHLVGDEVEITSIDRSVIE